MRNKIYLLVFMCTFPFTAIFAQDKNSEDTIQHISKFQKFNKGMEKFVKYYPLPVISYSSETNWLLGLTKYNAFKMTRHGVRDTLTQPSHVNALVYYTLNKQFKINLEGDVMLPGNKFNFSSRFTYLSFPELYFGTGNFTEKDSAKTLMIKSLEILARAKYKFFRNYYAGLSYSYLNFMDVYFTDSLDESENEEISKNEGLQSGFGLTLSYEGRDNRYNPDRGSYILLEFHAFEKWTGSDFAFTRWSADLRKYVTIVPKKLIIAGQLYTENVYGDVPVQSLAFLGGTSRMRGIYEGRYRDNSSSSGQLELRFPIVWIIGGVVFGSIGETAPDYSAYSFDRLHWAAGGGLRLMVDSEHRINIRFDFGFSKDDHTIYFGFMEAF